MIKLTKIIEELYTFGDRDEPPYSRFDTAREDKIQEIGETTATPYPTTKSSMAGSAFHKIDAYSFKTDKGTLYKAYVEKFPSDNGSDIKYVVSFKAASNTITNDFYSEINDPKNMYRVMATVLSAIKQSMKEDKENGKQVKSIYMEPTKKAPNDMRRAKLYTAVIQKNMPAGSRIESDEDSITVHLPTEQNEDVYQDGAWVEFHSNKQQ